MQRDNWRQKNRDEEQGKPRRANSSPIPRSPALDAAARQKRLARERDSAGGERIAQRPAKAADAVRRKVSYAADETLARPAQLPRKQLSGARNRGGLYHTSGGSSSQSGLPLRIGGWNFNLPPQVLKPWKPRAPEVPATPIQVISEEEQKKLEALEMQLPRVARKVDSTVLIIVLALLCIGLVMVYSASSFVAASTLNDPSYYFQKQLFGAVLGVAAMLITMRVDYRQWRRFSMIGMLVVFVLLIVVLKFGTSAYGASRWLAFGSFFQFQPSELAKLVLALYIADWLARKGKQVGTFLYGLAPFVILVGLIVVLVLLENDLGTATVIAGMATVMFFTAGANIMQFLLALACGIPILVVQSLKGYRYYRWIGFLDPFQYTDSINLQLYQSLLALGSGGWLGVGLGASRQKTGYLPLPHIDSIFAIIGEELGFLGGATIVILFLILAFRGFRLARRTPDLYGALLATGITTWLVLQAMVNVGVTAAAIPYTGVPLPFISFGGTSLVISLAAVGVLLNISRYIQEPEDPALSRQTIEKQLRTPLTRG
jgi:cell division protein FtsW